MVGAAAAAAFAERGKRPARRWTFVLAHYTQEEEAQLRLAIEGHCQYGVFGHELGQKGNYPHLQGFLILHQKLPTERMRAIFNERAYFAPAFSTNLNNIAYCKKDDNNIFEFGAPATRLGGGGQRYSNQSATSTTSKETSETSLSSSSRSANLSPTKQHMSLGCLAYGNNSSSRSFDFRDVQRNLDELMKEGARGTSLFAQMYPALWSTNASSLMYSWFKRQQCIDRPQTRVIWLHGETATGKTWLARKAMPGAYWKCSRSKWWDDYYLEANVIIDGLSSSSSISIDHLLAWFDKFKCRVETKGGMVPLHATNFIVTSNFSADQVYSGKWPKNQVDALLRRLNQIEITKGNRNEREIWNKITNQPSSPTTSNTQAQAQLKGDRDRLSAQMEQISLDNQQQEQKPSTSHQQARCLEVAVDLDSSSVDPDICMDVEDVLTDLVSSVAGGKSYFLPLGGGSRRDALIKILMTRKQTINDACCSINGSAKKRAIEVEVEEEEEEKKNHEMK